MIQITFFAPYQHMQQQILQVVDKYPSEEKIVVNIVPMTYFELNSFTFDWPCDVIIARGMSAEVFREREPNIPIIKMNFNSAEVINTIEKCREIYNSKKIAVIGPSSLFFAAKSIAKISGIPIEIFAQDSPSVDLPGLIDSAVESGCDTIIGGSSSHLYACKRNINSFLIHAEDETIWNAINEAVKTVQRQRQELEKVKVLSTVMNNSKEGFVLIDIDGKIKVLNQFAANILGNNPLSYIGLKFQDLFEDLYCKFEQVIYNKTSIYNEIFKKNSNTFSASFTPIIIENTVTNILLNFHDITNIQEMEGQIRNKLRAKGMSAHYTFENIVSNNIKMKATVEMARKFSLVDSNILIEGETGTGKEVFAQSIHNYSNRKNKPFIAVNCAALPEQLLESELFGYSSGAFTGAMKEGKQGLFELAHGGTLLLDEVSEIPFSFQSKLLRALQEREIRRIGDNKIIPVDVRIIAATNRNLLEMAEKNLFRNDLYFRLDVLKLLIAPLRERTEDILPLFQIFLINYAKKLNKCIPYISEQIAETLRQYHWKGNVRELQNIAERMVVLCEDDRISVNDFHEKILYSTSPIPEKIDNTRQMEKQIILDALKSNTNRDETAKALGLSRSTLWRRMKEYGIA